MQPYPTSTLNFRLSRRKSKILSVLAYLWWRLSKICHMRKGPKSSKITWDRSTDPYPKWWTYELVVVLSNDNDHSRREDSEDWYRWLEFTASWNNAENWLKSIILSIYTFSRSLNFLSCSFFTFFSCLNRFLIVFLACLSPAKDFSILSLKPIFSFTYFFLSFISLSISLIWFLCWSCIYLFSS